MQKSSIVSNPLYGGQRDPPIDTENDCITGCCSWCCSFSCSFLCCLWIF